MSYRLPRVIPFPWGFEVTVGVTHLTDAHGEWDPDTRHISIGDHLTPPEKRATLLHEIGHAYLDWTNWVVQNIPIKEPQQLESDPLEPEDNPD